MAEPEIHYRSQPDYQPQRSWGEAFFAFLTDRHASTLLKILLGIGPITLMDDIIPGLGLIDEPYLPIWIFVLILVYLRVSAYRNIPQNPPADSHRRTIDAQ
jgi:hypothetical protein